MKTRDVISQLKESNTMERIQPEKDDMVSFSDSRVHCAITAADSSIIVPRSQLKVRVRSTQSASKKSIFRFGERFRHE